MPPKATRFDPLSDAQLTKLLSDLEASEFPVDTIDIHTAVFKGQEKYYGNPGSNSRASFLRKFYQLRRCSIKNYCKCAWCERQIERQ